MSSSSLSSRDGDLVNNWYIACASRELGNRPILRIVYDQRLVLFRDGRGKAAVLPDRCLHRAAPLSGGHVEDGMLVCPYHGWKYDNRGRVQEIPSVGPDKTEGRYCSDPLPSIEQDGVVWVWMGAAGEEDVSKIWRFPHYAEKGWLHYYMVTDFENEVTNLVENFMDVPHTISVHKGWFRNPAQKNVRITTETGNAQVLVTYHLEDDDIGVVIRRLLNPSGAPMQHTDRFIHPNITRVDYSFGEHYRYVINSQCTPVTEMKTRVYTFICYKLRYFGWLLKPLLRMYTRRVISQDVWIMNAQRSNLDVTQAEGFQSVPADIPHLQIERLRTMAARGDPDLYRVSKRVETDFRI